MCDDGKVTVFAPHTEYFNARQALLETFGEIDFDVDEIQFIPETISLVSAQEREALETFLDMLDYLEDVQNVYHNAG
jgi:transcriptional/translational regulatory protein YebC/TACO1